MGDISGRISQMQQAQNPMQARRETNQMWGPPAPQQPAYQAPQRPGRMGPAAPAFATDSPPGAWGNYPNMAGMAGQLQGQAATATPVGNAGQAEVGPWQQAWQQRRAGMREPLYQAQQADPMTARAPTVPGGAMYGQLGQVLREGAGPAGPNVGAATPGAWGANPNLAGVANQLQSAIATPQGQAVMAQYGPQIAALAQQFGGLNLGALNQMPAAPRNPYAWDQTVQPLTPQWAAQQYAASRPFGGGPGTTMTDEETRALSMSAPANLGGIVPAGLGTRQTVAPLPAANDLQARLAAMGYGQLGRIPRM